MISYGKMYLYFPATYPIVMSDQLEGPAFLLVPWTTRPHDFADRNKTDNSATGPQTRIQNRLSLKLTQCGIYFGKHIDMLIFLSFLNNEMVQIA